MIRHELGCHTSLGVSNVSFGLPNRDLINSNFFALALGRGLSAAIMNPYSAEMMNTYYAYRALAGLDENCADFIFSAQAVSTVTQTVTEIKEDFASELQRAIVKGLKERAAQLTESLLAEIAPLDIVNGEIIPALDKVGVGFEKKTVYLPQLLMSAEAAKAAFERIKERTSSANATKFPIVIATVKGDIHDIGKNIVKLLLENYGYRVIDLGHDVAAEAIASAVEEYSAPLVGLSALMTTTVPAMKETIELIKSRTPNCRVMVGGAVLTAEYADMIGADAYAKDALGAVRYAESIINN
jgi:5-methyltetrahydrofolate--homocysteine methyltransferase